MISPCRLYFGSASQVPQAAEEAKPRYRTLPDDPETVKGWLIQAYAPATDREWEALRSLLQAYAGWRSIRDKGTTNHLGSIALRAFDGARESAAWHLAQALRSFVSGMSRHRRQLDAWASWICALHSWWLTPQPVYWQPDGDWSGVPLAEIFGDVCEATDPAELMAIELVAYSHRDILFAHCPVLDTRRPPAGYPSALRLWQRQMQKPMDWLCRALSVEEALARLDEMVNLLREVQAAMRQPLVRVVRRRQLRTKQAKRKPAPTSLEDSVSIPTPVRQDPGDSFLAPSHLVSTVLRAGPWITFASCWSNLSGAEHRRRGRQRRSVPTHTLVEHCMHVSVAKMMHGVAPLPATDAAGGNVYAAGFYFELVVGGLRIRQRLVMESVPMATGSGRRWRCRCDCGVTCNKLYLPPGGTRLACRGCHQLSYRDRVRNTHRQARTSHPPTWYFGFASEPHNRDPWVSFWTKGLQTTPELQQNPVASTTVKALLGPGAAGLARHLSTKVRHAPHGALPTSSGATVSRAGQRLRLRLVPIAMPSGGGHALEHVCLCGHRCRKLYAFGSRAVCRQCHRRQTARIARDGHGPGAAQTPANDRASPG